ncbi:PREDICTED: SH2 domain-containing adapter protein D-like isoform X1 [Poecilia mexicana]|uniref:SH2 domain-containing protein n=1 Tax=Poecilia mexicana TaxID=48701 RepID=A0A3B3WTS1_9TELE|nr:PREDICTED: SH2 domain-containing adapter protein D-like isoform X1 [Poecilia mexicana]XP_014843490.1 PREDICTED: SH2 domain-containing adapter protein D-like isoform X1 [Poecilia mexicana]XP_014843491.1 PREDICTED: SH2 domain-containing adapter protein D-like isoform X1 [Poecilia mexicana]XP_014843492.1 PREDICTED: SH2 domain-containing adapter protein D-like isoform X1 [Poecilia mexicana]XP_014843493.1 PREDICTED: SH2 domain-containing adapter protein D-like isoform X1 [Poecilia mexicana]
MAKWLKDYLSFGRKVPPQPPTPDYTESEILKAYRLQRDLDFEDPYEDAESRSRGESGTFDPSTPVYGSPMKSSSVDMKSPKHRLIKVDSQELGRTKILLSSISLEDQPEPVVPSAPMAGDTDYSDPFDARLEHRPDPDLGLVPCENNGYMEPYEAQRVITELQRTPGGGRMRGGMQLYDTPYEDERRQHLGYVYGELHEEGKETSRLPQDDERPADEYDQPWEWKKDHISKAFAEMRELTELPWPAPVGQLEEEPPVREQAQFDGAEWDRSSSPTERMRPAAPRSSPLAAGGGGGGMKFRTPHESPTMMGERVDPTLPLEKQVWYHGSLSRSEAESLLTLCKECSYLVRNSQNNRSDFSLSLRSCQGFMHMKFTLCKDGKYVLGQNSPPFDTIPEAVHFYTTHKLPIRGAEHLSLLFPVQVQTL